MCHRSLYTPTYFCVCVYTQAYRCTHTCMATVKKRPCIWEDLDEGGGSDKLLIYEIIYNKIIKHYRNKKEIMKPGTVAYGM